MGLSIWSYLQNVFDNVSKSNFKRMFIMATDHMDKLRQKGLTDPVVQNLVLFLLPFFNDFTQKYRQSRGNDNLYRMGTMRMENLLTELSGKKIRNWDVAIQAVFDIDQPEYLALLPNHRSPFQRDPYDIRINEVKILADNLALYPALATLKTEVEAYYNTMLTTRSEQQGYESNVLDNSDDLEISRVKLAQAMHGVFGALIMHHFQDVQRVESYYELKYLRVTAANNSDDEPVASEELNISFGSYVKSLEGKLNVDDEIRVTNTGMATLVVYTAVHEMSAPSSTIKLTVAPGQNVVLKALLGDNVVIIRNDIENFAGKALVELL